MGLESPNQHVDREVNDQHRQEQLVPCELHSELGVAQAANSFKTVLRECRKLHGYTATAGFLPCRFHLEQIWLLDDRNQHRLGHPAGTMCLQLHHPSEKMLLSCFLSHRLHPSRNIAAEVGLRHGGQQHALLAMRQGAQEVGRHDRVRTDGTAGDGSALQQCLVTGYGGRTHNDGEATVWQPQQEALLHHVAVGDAWRPRHPAEDGICQCGGADGGATAG
mmetsp:Transcript_85416/g.274936  ORF Transcript_85416/g.274936 Transcript_85416/m.274936 type:complete len:220 (+) Transcript_85416:111-770(+)